MSAAALLLMTPHSGGPDRVMHHVGSPVSRGTCWHAHDTCL